MMAVMGLIAYPGRVRAKTLRFAGNDLLGIPDAERRRLVGKDMAMIFQEPTTSLNPCFTIGCAPTQTAPSTARGSRRTHSGYAIANSRSPNRPAPSGS